MNIGKKIKELMADNSNFSPAGFTLALGKKNKQTYYDTIKRADINSKELIVISKYFNVPITTFFDKNLVGVNSLFIEERIELLEQRLTVVEKLLP